MSLLVQKPEIPSCAWQRPIGKDWEKPYTVRYASNLDDGPDHGMPLGGFGAGCIGRSPTGKFNLWHLDGGNHVFKNLPACQFSIYEQVAGEEAQAYAMATEAPEDGSLGRWQWYPNEKGRYSALYPRSWNEYQGVFKSELICEQFSPVWGGNYQESSYPLAIFDWTVHNPTDKTITLSIMLTWQNTVGWFTNAIKSPTVKLRDDGSPEYEYQPRWGDSTGNFNQWIQDGFRVGCLFNRVQPHDALREGEGQMCIASVSNPSVEVFYHNRWNPSGDGADVWDWFAGNGSLPDIQDETAAEPGEQIAGALCLRFTVRPGKTKKIPFLLAWDLPITEFAEGVTYYRRYTDFYGRNGKNVWSVIRTALKHSDTWRQKIEAWQGPILDNPQLPNWLKMALFNELYLLTQGGTLWTAATENDPVGQFGVCECMDYRWYESLDVRLYGSFGLLMHWPKLEQAVMLAFARAIPTADPKERVIGYNLSLAPRKVKNATPHDLGAPNEHPWERSNYTAYQDCNLWKDLGSDFVLLVYRDFLLLPDADGEFLGECWPSVTAALDYLKEFDLDNDGIPENSGAPDQTFDDWRLQGISAYCGGLWIAALEAALVMGKYLLANPPQQTSLDTGAMATAIARYETWLAQARSLYHDTLWNGEYYNLDSQSGSKVVMADQLCGQFYARLLNLPDVVENKYAEKALAKVYDTCFLKFSHGELGAANGLLPDGSPQNPNDTHPLEVWTGINFGLAAFLIQMGKKEEALKMTETVVNQVYSNGLQFRTPEAITAVGTFRASHYLRAMAIWAVYGLLEGFANLPIAPADDEVPTSDFY
ncbi:bile acid beta-glucosidase [Synechocystis sp. FACHB-383]|uniref:GH116 family glycosyl hydrolase n=1 Tax=Synechocystis sp. FACHB-383 TaxID=2692864 RepID=UPI00168253A4|nr:GH116 family glycosyl hydrolase [Synechocystis sp. FACHB-383]MBD2655319.1 bile acid beta-glucosidase [Synechocystis sp. FACHB-383]